jgi:hypothetical protein
MSRAAPLALSLPLLFCHIACVPQDGALDGLASVLGATAVNPSDSGSTPANLPGAVRGTVWPGGYQVFDLGPSDAGRRWRISPDAALGSPIVAALFDQDMNLLGRAYMSSGARLDHILRTNVETLYLGIAGPLGGRETNYSLRLDLADAAIPPPQRHVVWLNFAGGRDVRVHGRDPVTFGMFDAGIIGADYAGQTQAIKDLIVAAVRLDYAAYDIDVLSSDDGPPPDEPHSVVHFGGYDPTLLGLADSVDRYNVRPSESAIVYVGTFAAYRSLGLSDDEVAVMLANVASHELGHLLGLYHTADADDIMDTTGSVWDLADAQAFRRAKLEPSVFPTGMENSPEILQQTLGISSSVAKLAAQSARTKLAALRGARQFSARELRHACGTCADPDH